MDKLKMHTPDLTEENFQKLATLFPDAVTETVNENGDVVRAIDADVLRQEISAEVVEGNKERYQFTWPDKKKSVVLANAPIAKTLRLDREKSVGRDGTPGSIDTENIYIEGDNLDALKLLQETYLGKVKMIYIDPPYNTGSDAFVYDDDFAMGSGEFAQNSGAVDEAGNRLFDMRVNNESNGRFHTDWLNMIYPRLRLANDLLADDGVIFISIDDNEQENLKKICDEVFGEKNFVATIPWRKRTAKADVPHGLSQDYEWMICYSKEAFRAGIEKETRKYYETDDFPGRPWRVHDMTKQTTAEERPMSYFTIVDPKNGKAYPASKLRTWAITSDTLPYYESQKRIVFPGDYDFLKIQRPVLRYWKEDDEKKAGDLFGMVTATTDLPKEVGMTQDGTKDITELFGEKAFGFPKPVSLIKHIIGIATPRAQKVTILDFFAGSGTTLHATMQLNAEDGGHRQCILVTNNENGICENVTYERNRRVICGYTTPKGQQVEGLRQNNLRYYRTAFIPRERTQRNMRALVNAATDLLCIKENLYRELPVDSLQLSVGLTPRQVRLFADGTKGMMVIYDEQTIPYIVEGLNNSKLSTLNSKLKIYVFSPGRYAFDDDFFEVRDKVQLVALPAAIYDAYQRVLPKRKEKLLETETPAGFPLSKEGQGRFNTTQNIELDFEEGGKQ